jgi:hypothetical protein
MVTAYCVKYALTQGIFKIEGEINGLRFMWHTQRQSYMSLSKLEWAITLECAKELAKSNVEKKIKSLTKQITKLEKIEIEVHEKLV